MTKNGETVAHEAGLSVQQWLVLLQIANDPNFPNPAPPLQTETDGVLSSEIASARGVSRPNISALVAVLLRKRLVRQVDDTDDRRRKRLHITDRGLRALEKIEPQRRSVNDGLLSDFSAEEIRSVSQFHRRLLQSLWHRNAEQET